MLSNANYLLDPRDALVSETYVAKEGEPPGPAQAAFNELVPGRAYNISVETVSEGMIPKIRTCIKALDDGVKGVVIIDGRKNHSILFELLSDKGSGTLIRQ